jgi:hypothetical protein
MQNLIRLGGLLILGLALIVPTFAGDEKKDTKKDAAVEKAGDKGKTDDLSDSKDEKKSEKSPKKTTNKGKDDKKEKFPYNPRFFVVGKLTQLDANSPNDFTLQVKVPEVNPDTVNRLNQLNLQLAQQQQQWAQARDLNGKRSAANAMQSTQLEMVKAQANYYRYKDQDFPLRAAENLQVRWAFPPPDYDEKGNLKKYTKEELKALRGTEGLPGYRGDKEVLQKGQVVRAYLKQSAAATKLQKASQKAPAKGKKTAPATTPEAPDDVAVVQDRPEVLVIEILAEPKQP